LSAESHLTRRLFGSILRQIEALPLPAGPALQDGEINLDEGRELREGCLRNRFETKQIMAFWFWQRLCRARLVLWLWNECRNRSKQRQLAIYCRRWESKMNIPVETL